MKWNADKGEEIINLVRGGAGQDRAAKLAGVDPATVRRWRAHGEQNPGTGRGKFAKRLAEARAELMAGCERTLFHNAIKRKDSADAKWLLTRLAPDEYGDKVTIEVRETMAAELLDHLQTVLDAETYDRVLAALSPEGGREPAQEPLH